MRSNLALAETLPFPDPGVNGAADYTYLRLVPDQSLPEQFINADIVPELQSERQRAAQNAARILGKNRHMLHTGGAQAEYVPKPVDALGTARQAVEAKQRYGADSPEYQEIFEGVVLDAERLLGEAYSKNTSEYFAKIKQDRDADTGNYFSHGLSISTMVENGLSPLANKEEQSRRLNEAVEENGTYEPLGNLIGSLGLRESVKRIVTKERSPQEASVGVFTISECTDTAIEDYKFNSKGSHGGYAPAVEKLMIRGVHYFDDSGDRHEEQVALPGIYITHDVINDYLAQKGVTAHEQTLSKTEVHATQFISVNGTEVMDIARDLDKLAGEAHGVNLFMGEVVWEDHPKDYGEYVEDAEVRRAKLAPKPTELAEYLITLQENGTDPRVAMAFVDRFLKATLLEVAAKHPELAEAMFDKATAEGFVEVNRLVAAGNNNDARKLEAFIKENAPEVSYCGGGAGGCAELDDVDPSSPAGILAKSLGLKGRMVRNKEAACKDCNAKELHHDYNGNTVCTSCKSTKLSGQGVRHGKVASLDKQREKSKKARARQSAPLSEKAGEVVALHPRSPKQAPAS